jgi:uncharacterized membrane protein YcaP (DUF421 family)
VILVTTIVAIDRLLGVLKDKSPNAARWLDDLPSVLVSDGVINEHAMKRNGVDKDDVMEAARWRVGIESFDRIRFAVLERTGGISVIPWPDSRAVTPPAR